VTRMTFVGKITTITCPGCQCHDLWYHKPLREELATLYCVRQIEYPAQWRCDRCGIVFSAERLRDLKVYGRLVQQSMSEREQRGEVKNVFRY